ncbi:MAG: NADH-quinone oxidoreductase subunit L [Nitrososphaeria archaeon]
MADQMIFAWLAWVFPLLGAVLTPLFAAINKRVRDFMAVAFSFLAVVSTLSLTPLLLEGDVSWPLQSQVSWLNVEGSPILGQIKAGVLVDPLSIIMSNVVSIIAFLIMVYSIEYMKGEEGLTRYWFFMNLFIGNMLLLVLSDNLIQMLFGWEGVGLCSYGLIGFYYKDQRSGWLKYWVGEGDESYPPSHAGMKAFITTRIGDALLFVGAFIILAFTGTLNFVELQNGAITKVPFWALLPAVILLFGGPIGKSAQLPLMEWLPDAMAGPTTVSALIHAATMVKAGVYLVARMFPILYVVTLVSSSPDPQAMFYFIAWIGAITAFVAGAQATVSTEIKKVLAYSTVSQIGYMMLALGVAGLSVEFITGYVASIFHLVSHAMFKAALFLAAGSVIHATGSRFMRDMGGLKKHMPVTFWSMLFASCSLAGVPLVFSGFWSKDMILEASLVSGEYLLFVFGLLTVAITAFYTFRMVGMVFFGEGKSGSSDVGGHVNHLHEASPVMWVPYVVLVAGTIVLGVLGYFARHWMVSLFEYLVIVPSETHPTVVTEYIVAFLSSLAIVVGFIPAYWFYLKRSKPADMYTQRYPFLLKVRNFLYNRCYINRVYYCLIVYPTISLSKWMFSNLEVRVIDGFNYYLGRFTLSFSNWMFFNFESKVVDELNYRVSDLVKRTSLYFRRWQTGSLNDDLIMVLAGLFIIVLILKYLISAG